MIRQNKKSDSSQRSHRITIQTLTNTTDSEGGFTEAWTDTTTVWAAVLPIKAQQRFDYKNISVDATHWIKIDGKVSINEKQRFKFGTRYFEILTIENIQEKSFELFVTCKETRPA